MEQKDFNILIVDDHIPETDPIVVHLSLTFKTANVKCFLTTEQCVDFVKQNTAHKTIIFLDCSFDNGVKQGIDALNEIRGISSLISIVMMSANRVSEMGEDAIIAMINQEEFRFVRNTEFIEKAEEIVREIVESWKVRFDCILEQWLLDGTDRNKIIYSMDGVDYTVERLIYEVRRQTTEGRELQRIMNSFAVKLLLDNKLK